MKGVGHGMVLPLGFECICGGCSVNDGSGQMDRRGV